MNYLNTILSSGFCSILINIVHAQIPEVKFSQHAKLFGASTISGPLNEFNTTFSKDEKTVFFSRSTADFSVIAIYCSQRIGDRWSIAKPVSFTGTYRDTDPVVSPDGTKLLFCSDRPLPGGKHIDFDYHFYVIEIKAGRFLGEPRLLEIEGNPKGIYPSLTNNGDIYYSIKGDIYYSEYRNGKYGPCELLSFNDSTFMDFDPVVSNDGSFIIFTSNNRKGYGNTDLYITFREGNKWTIPLNMGPQINGPGREGTPGLSRDNKTLFFSAAKDKAQKSLGDKRSASELSRIFNSYRNGLPNIYSISIVDIITR